MSGIEIERSGAKATLWLNRPERHNAFDDGLIAELSAALAALAADSAIRVVLLAGRGKSFSAGADLAWMKRMAGYTAAENEADAQKMAEMLHRLESLPKPTIALVQGAAMGGGAGLAVAADMVVMADNAKLGYPEVTHGIVAAIVMANLVRQVGRKAAFELVATGQPIDAARAHELGLANRVVPAAELGSAAMKIAESLAAVSRPAMATTKQLLHEVADLPLADALERGRETELAHPAKVLGVHTVIAGADQRLERQLRVSEILESGDVLRVHAVVSRSKEIVG